MVRNDHKLSCLIGTTLMAFVSASWQSGGSEETTLCAAAQILIKEPHRDGKLLMHTTVGLQKIQKLGFDSRTQTFKDLANDSDLNDTFLFQRPILCVECGIGRFDVFDTELKRLTIVLDGPHIDQADLWGEVLCRSLEENTPSFYNAMWKDVFQTEKEALGLTHDNCFRHLDVSTEKGIIFFAEEFQKVYRNGGKGNRHLLPEATDDYIASKLQQALRTCVSTNCARAFQLLIGDLEKLNEVFDGKLLEKEFLDKLGSAHDLWRNYFALELKKEVLDVFGLMSTGGFTYANFATKLAHGFLLGQILLLKDYVQDVGSRTKLATELGESILAEYWVHVKNEVDHADLYRTLKEDVATIIQGQIMSDL